MRFKEPGGDNKIDKDFALAEDKSDHLEVSYEAGNAAMDGNITALISNT